MPGVEFLPAQPDDAEGEELLDTGRHRSVPRWLIVVALAAVAIAAVLVTVDRRPSTRAPKAAATSSPATSRTQAAAAASVPGDVDAPLRVGRDHQVIDVVADRSSTWLLESHTLISLVNRADSSIVRRLPGPALVYPRHDDASSPSNRLVLDDGAGVIWIVEAGRAGSRLFEFDARTLALERQLALPSVITSAAALSGHLYLGTSDGVTDVAPHRAPQLLFTFHSPSRLGPVVADPARHRLLVTTTAFATLVWVLHPGAAAAKDVTGPFSVDGAGTRAGIVVAAGAIWLTGLAQGHGIAVRLDPRSFQPVRRVVVHGQLAVAAGSGVFWLRDVSSSYLSCMDARTGRPLQTWYLDGPVASVAADRGPIASAAPYAVVGTAGGAVPLRLVGCSG